MELIVFYYWLSVIACAVMAYIGISEMLKKEK